MFKKYFNLNNLSTLLLYFSILAFTVAFNFTDNRSGGWYQQFLTNIGNRSIVDITFTDSLNGYSITSTSSDTSYILKTTNGGDNWNVKYFATNSIFKRIQFINQTTGVVGGVNFIKTTNSGENWFVVSTSLFLEDMSVLNNDTAWYSDPNGLVGGVYKTTNGGTSWARQLNLGTLNPDHIYMYNKDIGFISKVNTGAPYTRKTTDGGQNWFVAVNNEGFTDIYFTDSLTGWRAYRTMKKSTDGGLSWVNQILPQGGYINLSQVLKFSNINADTIWGVNGYVIFPNNQLRGIVYRTTNSGNNWFYQVPDTAIHASNYYFTKFVTENIGWAYTPLTGIHTKVGGDTIFTTVKYISNFIPNDFRIEQNYPNPFNPNTKIKFEISKKGNVTINILNITGKQTETILNSFLSPGEYETEFNGSNYTSGIYFYNLIVDGIVIDTKKMILLK